MAIGFCSDERLVEHATGPHHPERPDRLRAVYQALSEASLLDRENPFTPVATMGPLPTAYKPLLWAPQTPATREHLLLAHTAEHIDRIERICRHGGGVLDTGDTVAGANGHELAMLSLSCALGAADAVMNETVPRAFAAVRPPGHHAEPDRPMGFCLYSNIAIVARHIQRTYGIGRLAIVDFDVHHGNGTQAVFEADPSVLFISIHQDPRTLYPRTGYEWEIGTGDARGTTINICMEPGSGDDEYERIFNDRIDHHLDQFKPEMLLVSAGFDAHADDPLSDIQLSEAGFEMMTHHLVAAAERHCNGKLVSIMEGGYHLRALGRCVVKHCHALGESD